MCGPTQFIGLGGDIWSRCVHRVSLDGRATRGVEFCRGFRVQGDTLWNEDGDPYLFRSSISFSADNLIAAQILPLTTLQQWPNVSPSASASLITPRLRDDASSRPPAASSATITSKSSLLRPSVVTVVPSSAGCVFLLGQYWSRTALLTSDLNQ